MLHLVKARVKIMLVAHVIAVVGLMENVMIVEWEYGFGERGIGTYMRDPKTLKVLMFFPDASKEEIKKKIKWTRGMETKINSTIAEQKKVIKRKNVDYNDLENTVVNI